MLHPLALWDAGDFILAGLQRFRYVALGVAGGVLALTLASLLLLPRSYTSEAKLLIKFGRENNLDPTAATGQMVSVYDSRENEINSLLEVFHSRQLLTQVVRELGPEFILYGRERPPQASPPPAGPETPPASEPASATTQFTAVSPAPAELPRPVVGLALTTPVGGPNGGRLASSLGVPTALEQLAIQKLEKSLQAFSPRKSRVIAIECQADRPETAQKIAAKLLEVYLEEHLRVHHTVGSYEFFQQQVEQGRKQWEHKAADLRAMKDRLGIVSLAGQLKQLQDALDGIETRLLANRADLAAAETKVTALRDTLSREPERVDAQAVRGPSQSAEGMRQSLFALHGREKDMSSRMTDDHPLLQAVRHQLEATSEILNQQNSQSTQTTQAVNPAFQAIQLQLRTEEASAKGLRGQQAALLRERSDCKTRLERLRGDEFALSALEREAEQAESRYRAAAEKLEQARINRSLDAERISSLNIVQPASYNPQPGGPKRSLTLAFGLVVALGGGVAAALGLHWLNPLLLGRESLAAQTGLPVLGIAPAALAAVR